MNAERSLPDRASEWIRASGLGGIAAALLEGLGPLGLVAGQLAYLAGPLFGSVGQGPLNDLAGWLENPDRLAEFASQLRNGREP